MRRQILDNRISCEHLCSLRSDELATEKDLLERKKIREKYHFDCHADDAERNRRRKRKEIETTTSNIVEMVVDNNVAPVHTDATNKQEAFSTSSSVVRSESKSSSCSFVDVDGTSVSFKVLDGGVLEEWMETFCVNSEIKTLIVWPKRGIIHDGTEERIRMQRSDRARVISWLSTIEPDVTCTIDIKRPDEDDQGTTETGCVGGNKRGMSPELKSEEETSRESEENDGDDNVSIAHIAQIAKRKKTKSKRKRKRRDEEDKSEWKTYFTEEDNETLEDIAAKLGLPVDDLVDNNIDTYPMITATSRLYPGTAVFLEPMDASTQSKLVEDGDIIFVRWPLWGHIWYECVVREGEDVPWVVESAPHAEPMFTDGPYIFWYVVARNLSLAVLFHSFVARSHDWERAFLWFSGLVERNKMVNPQITFGHGICRLHKITPMLSQRTLRKDERRAVPSRR